MKGLVVVWLTLQDVAVTLNSLVVGSLEKHHLRVQTHGQLTYLALDSSAI